MVVTPAPPEGEGEGETELLLVTLGDNEAEREGEGEIEGEAPDDPLGESDTDVLADSDTLIELGDIEAEGEILRLVEAEGEVEEDGDWLAAYKPSSVSACPAVRLSVFLLMSRFEPILNAPRIPRSSESEMPPPKDCIS